MPKPLVCRPGFGAAECSVLAYTGMLRFFMLFLFLSFIYSLSMSILTLFTAFRRALRNNKEYSGISRGDEEAELLTVSFDAGSLMEDIYMWQEEYNAQNEEITDEAVPLKPFALDRRPPKPSHFYTIKELAKPRSLHLPSPRERAPYQPNMGSSAQRRKSEKSHRRSRTLRDHERRKKQLAVGSSLKACAMQNIARSRLASNIVKTDFQRQKAKWVGKKIAANEEAYSLEELLAMPELKRMSWDAIPGSYRTGAVSLSSLWAAAHQILTTLSNVSSRSLHRPT
ncbi:hypothetical protein F5880DRAFT_20901 [Lentinula raphanica]|nr:hypothetical protein F5880DRAFT_20901 [Lentinula raphanica]